MVKTCDVKGCEYHRRHDDVWQNIDRENPHWECLTVFRCHHPNARAYRKPDSTGGVKVGDVCWSCKGYWKTTIFEDGLDIFVPDEEMVEMYKIISRADYTSPLKYQLLNEIMKLIPLKTLKEIQERN